MYNYLKKFFFISNKSEKSFFLILFIVSLIAVIVESVSLGLLIPLITLVFDSELLFDNLFIKQIIYYFKIPSETFFVKILFIVIIIFYFIKLFYLIFFTWIKYVFVNNYQLRIANDLFTAPIR